MVFPGFSISIEKNLFLGLGSFCSSGVFFGSFCSQCFSDIPSGCQQFCVGMCNVLYQIDYLVGITPLIVVPCDEFYKAVMIPAFSSKMQVLKFPRRSAETSSSLLYSMIPFIGPSAASLITLQISSYDVFVFS